MTEPSPPPPNPPWGRLVVTVGLLAWTAALPHLGFGLPGLDTSVLEGQVRNFSIFALGIMPLLSAMGLVELAAACVPRWRPLRHGGPAGRRKLGRATLVVAPVLCAVQGFVVARMIEGFVGDRALGSFSAPMVMLSLAAGTFFLALLAHHADVRGLGSGLGVILVAGRLADCGEALLVPFTRGEGSGRALAGPAALAVVTIAATWFVLRTPRAGPAPGSEAPGDRALHDRRELASTAIPAPASGVAVLFLAVRFLAIAEICKTLAGGKRPLFASETIGSAVLLLLLVALGVCFTWICNAPSRIAGLAARAGEGREKPEAGDVEGEVRRGMREAMLRSVAFLVVLFAIGCVTGNRSSAVDAAVLAMGTALVLDAAAEWRARRALPDLVPVWPEHRPYALAVAREALAGAGIAVHARGERLRRLLQFGGPYVPIDLMVPRADAARAAAILEGLLRYHPEDQPGRKPVPARRRRPWTRVERCLLAVSVVLGGGALLLSSTPLPAPQSRAPARPEALQVLAVDDDDDPFSPRPEELPVGVSIFVESVPLGPDRKAFHHFAHIVAAQGEGQEQARAGLLAWAGKRTAPLGIQVRAESAFEYDEAKDVIEQIGWRTYLLNGAPIIDGSDVKSATALPSRDAAAGREAWQVCVNLGAAGAERFRAFTASHVNRRMAIVVDGVVESVPVIREEIGGGRLVITMGGGSADQRADAMRLQARLLGKP